MYEMRINYKNAIQTHHAHTERQALDVAEYELKHCGATAVAIHHHSYNTPRTYVLNRAGEMTRHSELQLTTSDNIVVSRKALERVLSTDIDALAFFDISIAQAENSTHLEKSRAHVKGRKTFIEAILRGRFGADE